MVLLSLLAEKRLDAVGLDVAFEKRTLYFLLSKEFLVLFFFLNVEFCEHGV